MKIKSVASIFFILLICANSAVAQKPNFKLWQENYFTLNPAFTGIGNSPRINMGWMNILPNLLPGFQAYSLSYDHPLNEKHALGANALYYVPSEVLTNTIIGAQYAYTHACEDDLQIRIGSGVSLIHSDIDTSKIIVISPEPFKTSMNAFNISIGGLLLYKNLFAGISSESYSNPASRVNGENGKFSFFRSLSGQAGGFLPLGKDYTLMPNLSYFGTLRRGNVRPGINVNKGIFTAGVQYHYAKLSEDLFSLNFGISKGKFKGAVLRNFRTYEKSGLSRSPFEGEMEFCLSYYFHKQDKTQENTAYYFRKMGF